jgi:hypothetical protein
VEVAYHPGEWPQAEIIAVPAEYAAMAVRIAELALTGTGEASFPAAASREPSALVVRIRSGPAVVAVSRGELSVCGGAEEVGLFGLNMPSESSLPPGYHIHFEHAGREWFVAPESLPLVMAIGSAPDAEPDGMLSKGVSRESKAERFGPRGHGPRSVLE